MKKKMLNRIKWSLLFFVVAVFMTACSALGESEEADSQAKYINEAQILERDDIPDSDQNELTENAEEQSMEMTEQERRNEVFYLGETITNDMLGAKIEYTLEKVDVVENINELGISRNDIADFSKEKILESGELDTVRPSKFVVATVKVKNVNINPDNDEENFLMCMDFFAGCESAILDEKGSIPLEGCYYSAHRQEKDYWYFSLGIGEDMIVQVGWIVPEAQLEEPFYYVIGGSGFAKQYQYFRLNP